mmetsp:Transcript_11120/g.14404  ORF Transcript_11120/g.14404 Transcript_11120/m.14404 type:complete len:200 (+) Transcript_11120:471-1070(+)
MQENLVVVKVKISDCAACLLHDAALSHKYWSLAVKHVCWLRNRLIHRSLDVEGGGSRSPFQALHGRPAPDLLMSKVFGADAWRYNHLRDKSELSPKGIRGVFVGVSPDRKGWLILSRHQKKFYNGKNHLNHLIKKHFGILMILILGVVQVQKYVNMISEQLETMVIVLIHQRQNRLKMIAHWTKLPMLKILMKMATHKT